MCACGWCVRVPPQACWDYAQHNTYQIVLILSHVLTRPSTCPEQEQASFISISQCLPQYQASDEYLISDGRTDGQMDITRKDGEEGEGKGRKEETDLKSTEIWASLKKCLFVPC